LPLSLLRHLKDKVPCEEVSFFGLDSSQQGIWFGPQIPAIPSGPGCTVRLMFFRGPGPG
jgi:hypothetical protein